MPRVRFNDRLLLSSAEYIVKVTAIYSPWHDFTPLLQCLCRLSLLPSMRQL